MDHATSKDISNLLIVGGVLVVIVGFSLWDQLGHTAGIGFAILATGIFLRSDSRAKAGATSSKALRFAGVLTLALGLALLAARVGGL